MDLSRSWARHLFRASGVALLVPGAIVAAFLVLALAGGFGHLGTFRQIIAGPSVSRPNGAGGGVSVTSDKLAAALAANSAPVGHERSSAAVGARAAATQSVTQRTATRVVPAAADTPTATTGTPAISAGTGAGATHRHAGSGGGAGTHAGAGSGSTHTTSTPPTPAPPTKASPKGLAGTIANVAGGVDKTTATVAAVAGDVPPPVGPVAAGTVSSVGSTVTTILTGAGKL